MTKKSDRFGKGVIEGRRRKLTPEVQGFPGSITFGGNKKAQQPRNTPPGWLETFDRRCVLPHCIRSISLSGWKDTKKIKIK
jgi:hypothetical protein